MSGSVPLVALLLVSVCLAEEVRVLELKARSSDTDTYRSLSSSSLGSQRSLGSSSLESNSQRSDSQRSDSQRSDSQRSDSQSSDSQCSDSQRSDSQRSDSRGSNSNSLSSQLDDLLDSLRSSDDTAAEQDDDYTYPGKSDEASDSEFSQYKSRSGKSQELKHHVYQDQTTHQQQEQQKQEQMRVMNGMAEKQKQTLTDLHNKMRKQEGSSNMETLRYNEKLAALGQTWCQRCVFEHGQPPFNAADFLSEHLGQNIYASTDPNFKVEDACNAWYNEKSDYNYDTMQCTPGKMCGHYTAVTWADTTDVGCGLCYCPSISGLNKAQFIVCNYIPPGNWAGQKPFKKGSECTQCDSGKFYCNNGLCDKSCTSATSSCQCKAACKKCGKQSSDCSCQCQPGTMGPDCSQTCQDLDTQCNKNPGYPPFLCGLTDSNWAFVKNKCPLMCGQCKGPSGSTQCRESKDKNKMKNVVIDYLKNNLNKK